MKILLIGNHGQLGWELERTLAPLGEVLAVDFPEIDLAQADAVRGLVRHVRPDVIVNAAAYTAVDRAESEPQLAMAINGTAPGVLAEESLARSKVLVHFSTDYVFDGTKGEAYIETDATNPVNTYGKTKLAGEQAILSIGGQYLILRTSWVYSLRGDSFVNKVLRWAHQQDTLRVASDQVGSPTWARMLAEVTAQVLVRGRDSVRRGAGLYHLAGSGAASRLEWAKAILELDAHRTGRVVREVLPALTTEFPAAAARPLFSALNCSRFAETFGLSLPPWEDTLRLALGAIGS